MTYDLLDLDALHIRYNAARLRGEFDLARELKQLILNKQEDGEVITPPLFSNDKQSETEDPG